MNWNFLFFSLTGRIGRLQWWIGMLIVEFFGLALSILGFWLIGEDYSYYWNEEAATPRIALVEAMVFIFTLRASFAVDVKRIHDRARTAFLLIPLYLFDLLMIIADGLRLPFLNFELRLIETGYPWFLLVKICLTIAFGLYALWMLVELGIFRGSKGSNQYGPDPVGDELQERPA